MSARRTVDQLPARYQEQIAAQMGANKQAAAPAIQPPAKIIRQQSGDGMNKTERAFLEWLRDTYPTAFIHREVSLSLANGVRYKVDFLSVHGTALGAVVRGWEVKGYMRDDAAVKIKVAADVYRWITFTLVVRAVGGGWKFQEVKASETTL